MYAQPRLRSSCSESKLIPSFNIFYIKKGNVGRRTAQKLWVNSSNVEICKVKKTEAVLTSTQIYILNRNMKISDIFYIKVFIFWWWNFQYICISLFSWYHNLYIRLSWSYEVLIPGPINYYFYLTLEKWGVNQDGHGISIAVPKL